MGNRLSSNSVAALPFSIAVPAYDRARVTPGIVHLGVGAFHRAHQAAYIDDCLAAGETGWGVVGASLQSASTATALLPQDGLYTLAERSGDGERLRVIGSILSVLVAPQDPGALLDALADPRIRIVTLTITEKAYLRNAAGDLDTTHPHVVADLANPDKPRTAHGFLVEALARRRAAGSQPFTILSCDNLPANGETLHRLLVQFAGLRDPALARHLAGVACPSSMVDRIVPATTDADRARVSAALGVDDAWPVMTEPFRQWVIEDRFPVGRPDWEKFGVTMVRDVRPFEEMKLRLLNGAHSSIAYLGLLAGHETVAASFGDPAIRRFVQTLWAEAIPTLPSDADLQPWKYIEALTERFDNPVLCHRTAQIALDGSQKLPQRIIATALERAGREPAAAAIGIQQNYRETITRRHIEDFTHKRLRRGVGQFARVKIEFQPNTDGEDLVFESRLVGDPLPEEYVLGVERGIRSAMGSGPFAGFPIVGIKATLVDGAYHPTDSSVRAFEMAGLGCFREAASKLGFQLELSSDDKAPGLNEDKTTFDRLMLVPAAWIAAAEARGKTLPAGLFTDPLDEELTRIFSERLNSADTVRRVFDAAGFGVGDAKRDRLIERTAQHLELLRTVGVVGVLSEMKRTIR